MLASLSLPVLVGAAGLATDTIQWTLWKRQIQRQADSAALAGAYARAQGKSASASATADLTRNASVTLSATPTIENAPTAGAYAGNDKAVRVILQTQQTLPFSSLFLPTAPVIQAEATAAAVSNGNYCILALESDVGAGVTMQGNATVNMGCGIASNSKGSNAVSAGGSSTITATPVAAVGGLQGSSNYLSPTTLLPYSVAQEDPYAARLPVPAPSSCSGPVNVNPNGSATVSPGCYRGMDIKGTVTFSPGIYYIDGGTVSFGSQAVVSGAGVTFILTSTSAASNPSSIATISMNGGASVNLTATTSGTYAGILFYQDPRANFASGNTFNGNASSTYQGAIYMPRQEIQFSGTSGMNTNCLQIVARRVVLIGNSAVNNVCPSGSGASSFTGTRVLLVG